MLMVEAPCIVAHSRKVESICEICLMSGVKYMHAIRKQADSQSFGHGHTLVQDN